MSKTQTRARSRCVLQFRVKALKTINNMIVGLPLTPPQLTYSEDKEISTT